MPFTTLIYSENIKLIQYGFILVLNLILAVIQFNYLIYQIEYSSTYNSSYDQKILDDMEIERIEKSISEKINPNNKWNKKS